MARHIRALTILERCLWRVGWILLTLFAAALVDRSISSRQALGEFDQARAAAIKEDPLPTTRLGSGQEVDFSLWSAKRVRAYRSSLPARVPLMAVVYIEKVNLRVPVFEGTDEWALNRGAGWIAGTARPGKPGNIGIAGHRDGFFRRLKDVSTGDAIELLTTRNTAVYTVDRIEIVRPEDVKVLRPRAVPALTLVTCYPFYFIGGAPKRYVIEASLKERGAKENSTTRSEGK